MILFLSSPSPVFSFSWLSPFLRFWGKSVSHPLTITKTPHIAGMYRFLSTSNSVFEIACISQLYPAISLGLLCTYRTRFLNFWGLSWLALSLQIMLTSHSFWESEGKRVNMFSVISAALLHIHICETTFRVYRSWVLDVCWGTCGSHETEKWQSHWRDVLSSINILIISFFELFLVYFNRARFCFWL